MLPACDRVQKFSNQSDANCNSLEMDAQLDLEAVVFFVKEHVAENLMVGCGRSASLHNVFAARTKTSWSTVPPKMTSPRCPRFPRSTSSWQR